MALKICNLVHKFVFKCTNDFSKIFTFKNNKVAYSQKQNHHCNQPDNQLKWKIAQTLLTHMIDTWTILLKKDLSKV